MADIGRNDPCPCGSGRKYKHCCLHTRDASRTLRLRLRQTESRVVPALLDCALNGWGQDLLDAAWEEFVLWDEEVPDSIFEDPDFPLFLPWFLFSYVPDPHEEEPLPDAPTAPIGLTYLEEHDDIDGLDRELIESACAGGFSFHAVRDVTRGESVTLKDILTGREVRALEHSGTEALSPGDILFAFPATAGGGTILLGCAPIIIPPAWHNRIIDFRQQMWKRRRPTPADLKDADFELRDLYFEIAESIYDPKPPVLTNTDGEPLVLTTLTYELRASVQETFEVFKGLGTSPAAKAGTEGDDDVERNDDGTIARAVVRWLKDDETLLGTVTIEEGVLRAEVNSAERAARIQDEVASRLGDRVVLTGTDSLTSEEMMAQAIANLGSDRPLDASGDIDDIDDIDDERAPELAAIEAEVMAKHWATWVDEPVPALGGKTPRQAAKSALGRERLEALFAEFAWRSDQQPAHQRVDVAALRQTLGLPDPTRSRS
jgi:hypothetical protein